MIINNYLNLELKEYYMRDFVKILDLPANTFWGIDDGLKNILSLINSNTNFQTLYSKKFMPNHDTLSTEQNSYLIVASVKEYYNDLKSILYDIKDELVCNDSKTTIQEVPPSTNPNFKPKSKYQIGCINNPDYFKINHFKIEIESIDLECHNQFWRTIESKFANYTNN